MPGMLKVRLTEPSTFLGSSGWSEVDSAVQWIRRPALFVVDTTGGTAGQSLRSKAPKMRHSTYQANLQDCALLSRHHVTPVVTSDGNFHCHEYQRYSDLIGFHTDNQEGKPKSSPTYRRVDGEFYVDFSSTAAGDRDFLPGDTFLGTPIEPDNWGMWLLNVIPSAIYYLKMMPEARFLCWARHPWQRRFLEALGLRNELITFQQPWRLYDINNLTFLQYSARDLSPTMSEAAGFQAAVDRFRNLPDFCQPPGIGSNIYVSRSMITKAVGYRALENETLLEDALRAVGFSIVKPEQFSLAQQAAIFSNARLVVGAGGAGMFNVVFCQPGTTVITIESSAHFIEGHANLFSALELEYGVIFGQQDDNDKTHVHKRWSVNVDAVIKTVLSATF